MNHLQIIMIMLFILLVLIIIVSCLNINRELTGQTGAAGRKNVKMLTIEVFN